MLYSVKLDGISIMSPSEDMGLLSAKLDLELNSAGSFSFKMPPTHRYYNYPKVMLSIVEVYEGDRIIWFGRVNGIKTNWNNEKEISCEGALAFLNDSIQEWNIWPTVGTTCSAKQFFDSLITRHNECGYLSSTDLAFNRVEIADEFDAIDVTKEVDYCTTFNAIQEQCVGCYGGYIFVERMYQDGNPINTIKWIIEMENASQPIQFGLNLLDLNSDISVSEIVTAVLPVGDDGNGNKIFITSVNPTGEKYIIDNDAAEKYGTVMQMVTFDDCHNTQDLYDTAVKWLASKQLNFEGLVISLSVAELKYMDSDYDAFRVGQLVHVKSLPHKMAVTDDITQSTVILDEDLMISKVSYDLLGAAKTITVGNIPHQALTDMASSSSGSSSGYSSSGGGGGGGGGGGSTVSVSPYITSGDLIGTIYVNGTGYQFKYDVTALQTAIAGKVDSSTYADDLATISELIAAKSTVSYTQSLSDGTTIGTITINGTGIALKAPTPTTVVANPAGTPSTNLTKLQVGNDIFNIPSGGGTGGGVAYGYDNPIDAASDGAVYILLDSTDKKQGTFLYMTDQWVLIEGRPYSADYILYDNGTENVAWSVSGGTKNSDNISLNVGGGTYSNYAITNDPIDLTTFSTVKIECRYRDRDYSEEFDISSYTGLNYLSFTYLTDSSHNEVAVGVSTTYASATTFRIDSRNGGTAEAKMYYMSLM